MRRMTQRPAPETYLRKTLGRDGHLRFELLIAWPLYSDDDSLMRAQ